MKTNITIKVDAEIASKARVLAARRGTSLSQLVAGQLETLIDKDETYEKAMQDAIARLKKGYNLQWSKPISRDELHER